MPAFSQRVDCGHELAVCGCTERTDANVAHVRTYHIVGVERVYGYLRTRYGEREQVGHAATLHAELHLRRARTTQAAHYLRTLHLHADMVVSLTVMMRSPAMMPTFSDGPLRTGWMMSSVSEIMLNCTPMPSNEPRRGSLSDFVSFAVVYDEWGRASQACRVCRPLRARVAYRVDIEIADGELCYAELLERIDALRERSYAQQKKPTHPLPSLTRMSAMRYVYDYWYVS